MSKPPGESYERGHGHGHECLIDDLNEAVGELERIFHRFSETLFSAKELHGRLRVLLTATQQTSEREDVLPEFSERLKHECLDCLIEDLDGAVKELERIFHHKAALSRKQENG